MFLPSALLNELQSHGTLRQSEGRGNGEWHSRRWRATYWHTALLTVVLFLVRRGRLRTIWYYELINTYVWFNETKRIMLGSIKKLRKYHHIKFKAFYYGNVYNMEIQINRSLIAVVLKFYFLINTKCCMFYSSSSTYYT